MSTRKTAYAVIAFILGAGTLIMGGLHYFAETGQFAPKSMTNDATKSDQKGSAVAGSGVPVKAP